MVRLLTSLVVAALATLGAAVPARASLNVDFTFFASRNNGEIGNGGGHFTVPGNATSDLADLSNFFFVWTLDGIFGGPGSFVYGLPDVVSFSATTTADSLTGLSLLTKLVPQANVSQGAFAPELFKVDSLGPDGAMTSPNADATAPFIGTLTIDTISAVDDAQLPEPASFALLGAGLIAIGVVRRRKPCEPTFH